MTGSREAGVEEVAGVLEGETAFLVASHTNPDGDAIGSMVGMTRALRAAGKDVVMWHSQADPVPDELRFLLHEGEILAHELPPDAGERTLLALDCATADRLAEIPPESLARMVVNVDHHHDNTRFGDVNLVCADASSTAEIVAGILTAAGLPITEEVAEPLYVGLVTDTGRFGYSNTGPGAHRLAAELVAAGIDLAAITRRLYEEQPLGRLRLAGRALADARPLLDGRLMVALLLEADFARAGAGPKDSDGIVEALRSVRGTEVAALARQVDDGLRVSLRASSERVDVSAIARAEGGGGHRAAAGFTSAREPDDLFAWLEERVAASLETNGSQVA